jgi:hypothetical protein
MTQIPSCPASVNESLVLVFRSGEDYVFTVGDSTTTLPIGLSSAAIGLFKSHGLGAHDVARLAAQWAMSRGMRAVNFAQSRDDFTDLYLSAVPSLTERVSQAA